MVYIFSLSYTGHFYIILTVLYKVFETVFCKTLIEKVISLGWNPGLSGSLGLCWVQGSSMALQGEQDELC